MTSLVSHSTNSTVLSVDSRGRPADQPDNDYVIDLDQRLDRVVGIQLAAAHIPESRMLFRSDDAFYCSGCHVTVPPLAFLCVTETPSDGSRPHTFTMRFAPTLNRATCTHTDPSKSMLTVTTAFPHFADSRRGQLIGSAMRNGEPLPLHPQYVAAGKPLGTDPYDLHLNVANGQESWVSNDGDDNNTISYCSYVEHAGLRLEHLIDDINAQLAAAPTSRPPVLHDAIFFYSNDVGCNLTDHAGARRLSVRLPVGAETDAPAFATGDFVRIVEDDGTDFEEEGRNYSTRERAITFAKRQQDADTGAWYDWYILQDFDDETQHILHDVAGCPDHGGATRNGHRYALRASGYLEGRLRATATYEGIELRLQLPHFRDTPARRAYNVLVGATTPVVWLADAWNGKLNRRYHVSSDAPEVSHVHGRFAHHVLGLGARGVLMRAASVDRNACAVVSTVAWAGGGLVRRVSVQAGSRSLLDQQSEDTIASDLTAGLHPFDFEAAARAAGKFLASDQDRSLTLVDVHGVSHLTIIPPRRFDQFSFVAFLRDAYRDRCRIDVEDGQISFRAPATSPGATIELTCGSRALARMLRLPLAVRGEVIHTSAAMLATATLSEAAARRVWQRTELPSRVTVGVHRSQHRLQLTAENLDLRIADVRVGAHAVPGRAGLDRGGAAEFSVTTSGAYYAHNQIVRLRLPGNDTTSTSADPVVRLTCDLFGSITAATVLLPGLVALNQTFDVPGGEGKLQVTQLTQEATEPVPALLLRSAADELPLEGSMRPGTTFAPSWTDGDVDGPREWPSNMPDAHCDVVQLTTGTSVVMPVVVSSTTSSSGGSLFMTVVDSRSLREEAKLSKLVYPGDVVRLVGPTGVNTDQYEVQDVDPNQNQIIVKLDEHADTGMLTDMQPLVLRAYTFENPATGHVRVVTDVPHRLRSTPGATVVLRFDDDNGGGVKGAPCIVYAVVDPHTVTVVLPTEVRADISPAGAYRPTQMYTWLVEVPPRSAVSVVCGGGESVVPPVQYTGAATDLVNGASVTIRDVHSVSGAVRVADVQGISSPSRGDRYLVVGQGDSRAVVEYDGTYDGTRHWGIVAGGAGYASQDEAKLVRAAPLPTVPWHHGVRVAPTAGMLLNTLAADTTQHLRTGQLPLPRLTRSQGTTREMETSVGQVLVENHLVVREGTGARWERVTGEPNGTSSSFTVEASADASSSSRMLRGDRWFSVSGSSTVHPTPHPLRPVQLLLRSAVPTLLFEEYVGSRLGFPSGMAAAETDRRLLGPHVLRLAPPDYILMTLDLGGRPTEGHNYHSHTWRGDKRPIFAKLYTGSSHLTLTANVAHRRYMIPQDVWRVRVAFFNPDWSKCDFNGRSHSLTLMFNKIEGSTSAA